MSDIVERLRAHGSKTEMEAADEIERLQALKTPATRQLLNITKAALDNAEAEIERLQADIAHHEADRIKLDHAIADQDAEIERLQGVVARIAKLECGLVDPTAGIRMFELARSIAHDALVARPAGPPAPQRQPASA